MSISFAATQSSLNPPGRKALWAGRILNGIPVLFLAMDGVMKVLATAPAVQGTAQLGYPPGVLVPLGLIQLAFLVLFLVPRTAVFGAVLWTAYLGGAVASHVRLGDPLFTHVLSPVYVATFLWAGLALRDVRVRRLLFPERR